jgi:flagellar biosynthesis GTPase FlhF
MTRIALASFLLLTACASFPPGASTPEAAAGAAAASPETSSLTPYLRTLTNIAPGDAVRQQSEIDAALAAAQQTRSADDTLRYALALGGAGPSSSNPVEAKRILSELLARANDLDPAELALANAFLREFDARVALYAELARQREEAEQRLESQDANDRRADALAAENRRLKRALAEAERKLEAVAEMERSLLEQAAEQANENQP